MSLSRGRGVGRATAVAVVAIVVSLLAGGCGDDAAGSVPAACSALAGIAQYQQTRPAFDFSTASPAETEDYFVSLRDRYAALARVAPASIRADASTLRDALADLVRELDRLGNGYSALLADPAGRQAFEAMDSDSVGAAADRVLRFRDAECGVAGAGAEATESRPLSTGSTGAEPPGAEVLRVTLPSGEIVRVIETTGQSALCVTRSTGSSGCFGIPPASMAVNAPQPSSAPPGSGVFVFLLPSGYPPGLVVREMGGGVWPAARSSNGRVLVVLGPDPSASRSAGASRSFEILDADGAVLARVSSSASAGGGSAPSGDPRVPLVACLRAQGLDVPDPSVSGGTAATQAFPAEVAARAWQNCRSIYAASVPASASTDLMAFVDCMATQGWLQAVMSGPPADLAAHNAASARCRAESPSIRAVVACLRGQGLDVADPAARPVPQRFDPPAASSAWTVCREVYRTSSAIPDSTAARVLAVPDCMADRGWIIVTTTGEPSEGGSYDKAAYDAARATCG